jgi:acetyl-CoA C-acetyltransferase
MAPVSAIPRLLARRGLKFDEIALWEIHEVFSAQVLCHIKAGTVPAASGGIDD